MNQPPRGEDQAVLDVMAKPGSGRSELIRLRDGSLRASLKSRPVEGQANEELVRLVGKTLKISPSKIHLVSGQRSKRKLLAIKGMDKETLSELLMVRLVSPKEP